MPTINNLVRPITGVTAAEPEVVPDTVVSLGTKVIEHTDGVKAAEVNSGLTSGITEPSKSIGKPIASPKD